jgi:transposase
VYDRFVQTVTRLVHAQCWSHTRRRFVEAERAEPTLVAEALARIGAFYAEAAYIREHGLAAEAKLAHRGEYTKPLVEAFFGWLKQTVLTQVLLPSNPFAQAARYALEREAALKVFLAYPNVPLDTNHLEREIPAIALGRCNWLFCWTEVGARYVGIVQSLIASCRLQGVDPYIYFVDVLQRIDTHPAFEVHLLTPRLWKQHFANNPLRSDLDRLRQ